MGKQQQARKDLKRMANHLQKLKLPLPVEGQNVPIKWAARCSEAIEAYLNGEKESLDEAFGLKRGKGKPPNPEHRKEIGSRANALREEGKSWKEVADALYEEGIDLDESTIRIYAREFTPTEIEKAAKELIQELSGK